MFQITPTDLHPHLQARMRQRGMTPEKVEQPLNDGWEATDAKPGTLGKVTVAPYAVEWEGQFYAEKEVSVYYKATAEGLVLLTARARYEQSFPRR